MPIDYSKSKIYKLTTIHNNDLVYYGSTVNSLCHRKAIHKHKFKKGILDCSSIKLFELGINDVKITLVEILNCNSKEELLQREKFYIDNNNCVNKNNPIKTLDDYNKFNKEYYQKYYQLNKKIKIKKEVNEELKKEEKKNKLKEYYQLNKDKFKEYRKEYYEINKEKINNDSKIYKKKHYQENKQNILNKKKEYYQKIKDEKK